MTRERIYIAGSYTAYGADPHSALQITQHNIDKAIETANKLIEQGHYVFIPHLSHYVHTHYSCKKDYTSWYLELDMTFLEHWATAIYVLPNWENSYGTSMELKKAKELGLKIIWG